MSQLSILPIDISQAPENKGANNYLLGQKKEANPMFSHLVDRQRSDKQSGNISSRDNANNINEEKRAQRSLEQTRQERIENDRQDRLTKKNSDANYRRAQEQQDAARNLKDSSKDSAKSSAQHNTIDKSQETQPTKKQSNERDNGLTNKERHIDRSVDNNEARDRESVDAKEKNAEKNNASQSPHQSDLTQPKNKQANKQQAGDQGQDLLSLLDKSSTILTDKKSDQANSASIADGEVVSEAKLLQATQKIKAGEGTLKKHNTADELAAGFINGQPVGSREVAAGESEQTDQTDQAQFSAKISADSSLKVKALAQNAEQTAQVNGQTNQLIDPASDEVVGATKTSQLNDATQAAMLDKQLTKEAALAKTHTDSETLASTTLKGGAAEYSTNKTSPAELAQMKSNQELAENSRSDNNKSIDAALDEAVSHKSLIQASKQENALSTKANIKGNITNGNATNSVSNSAISVDTKAAIASETLPANAADKIDDIAQQQGAKNTLDAIQASKVDDALKEQSKSHVASKIQQDSQRSSTSNSTTNNTSSLNTGQSSDEMTESQQQQTKESDALASDIDHVISKENQALSNGNSANALNSPLASSQLASSPLSANEKTIGNVERAAAPLDHEQVLEAINSGVLESNKSQKSQNIQLQDTINIHRKDFSAAVKEKVMVMINQKLQQVEIRLDPPELGNVHVRVNLQNEQAAVSFIVQNQQAKEAFEQNMGKLREMLAEHGVDVGDAHVNQQSKGSDHEGESSQNQQSGDGFSQDDPNTTTLSLQESLFDPMAKGVDYYA